MFQLCAGFLKVIAIAEPDKLRTTQLGRAFGAFAESREVIFGVALEITGGMAPSLRKRRSEAPHTWDLGGSKLHWRTVPRNPETGMRQTTLYCNAAFGYNME
ncbi:hypothetical protein ABD76_13710 [Paenibacillus dendritiformis]|uniref:hypothetical protein n=1 Tax=Paenibacillus dendritiformis TaxID=130049 RepID=UPI001F54CC48|nr:hypothetical protein [Paenibacillus dendritiformis]MBG9793489.1 hypothetical protein [Paenibacillus dendritiformis]